MALIADLCPHCQRVTRCHVVERASVAGGVLLGIPLVLPISSVTCSCGECGFEFRSDTWDHQRTATPDEAVSLDIERLLAFTNPVLKERLVLSALGTNPRLGEAFQLLEALTPGLLRTRLRDALLQWERRDAARQDRFLDRVRDCSEALRFARLMAGRYTTGAVGCLAGAVGCVAVWSVCLLVLGSRQQLWGWILIAAAGLASGGLSCHWLWHKRDRRWVSEVLMPEAQRAGIHLGTLLVILEEGASPTRVEDDLRTLRPLAATIRAQLGPLDQVGEDIFGSETL